MKFLKFILNLKQAYKLYFATKERDTELDSLLTTFRQYSFNDGRYSFTTCVLGNPLKDAGTAVRLIQHYGLELHIGMGYVDCRAVLPKSKWQNPINRSISSFDYGTFTPMNPDEVEDIVGFGRTVNEAVVKCLINAKIASII